MGWSRIKQRNCGIDLLRIVSMLMVVVLHIISHGGVLDACADNSFKHFATLLINACCVCAVNCFALTTGYLMADRTFKFQRLVSLWIQVVFYLLGGCLVILVIKPGAVGVTGWLTCFFPVSFRAYWYFSSYFFMCLFLPFIGRGLSCLSRKQMEVMIGIMALAFCVVPLISGMDPFFANGGYSPLWLLSLYVIGTYIKKYDFLHSTKKRWFLLGYITMMLLTWFSIPALTLFGNSQSIVKISPSTFITYVSPTVLIMSVCLLLFFSRVRVVNKLQGVIKYIAPLSFGVYLIHEQPFVRDIFISNRFSFLSEQHWLVLTCGILLSAVAIYIVCTVIEWLRIQFFKLLRVNNLSMFLGGKLDALFEK